MSIPTNTPQLLRYRSLSSPRLGPWHGSVAIARSALRVLTRRRMFWVLYSFSVLIFLLYFFGQYLQVFLEQRVSESLVRTGGVVGRNIRPDFLVRTLRDAMHMDGSADTYGDLMWTEGYIVMVLLAFAGSVIVGSDFQNRSLPFYLSKPIARRHYLAGKLLAVALLVNAMTTLPGLVLFIEYGFIDTWDYYWNSWRLLVGILAYGAALTVTLSLLLMATATWLRRTVPLVMFWSALFVAARFVQRWLVDGLDLSPRWRLIDIWNNMYLFGQWCFGTDHAKLRPINLEQPAYHEATIAMIVVCLLCVLYLSRRVRAVEVVS
jgi:ABC-type transport system involved in multi-copper enzyme maturation permease subunit